MKEILKTHEGKVKLVLRYTPFHEGADTIVKGLEAARRQGKFWETLDVVYEKQRQWADHHNPRPDAMWQYYPSAGLDVDKLRQDMEAAEIDEVLKQDMADAVALSVRQTPTFFVNGRPLPKFGLQELQELVDETVAEQYGR